MASWTDDSNKLTHYTPYISPNPAEAMIYVGKQLEEQYQEGLSKVNSYVSSLNGLDFAKQGAKDYVDKQLNNIKTGLSKSLAGDFSNQALVNQIGGAARTIANDPIVETNLLATANHKAQLSSISTAEKAGKSNTANEWDYYSKYQSWLNDGKLDTGFNDRYSEYVDHKKLFLDALKEVKPSANITQDQLRINDGTGQIEVLNQKEHEGIDAGTIQSVWNSVRSNPDVQNQLSIEGRYKYKGYQDKQSLLTDTKSSYDSMISQIDDRITSIQGRALIDKTLPQAEVDKAIKALQRNKDSYSQEYNNVAQTIIDADNLDEAKIRLYNNDLSTNLVSSYSWSKDKDTIVDSPVFKAHMEQAKYELEQVKEANNSFFKNADLGLKREELQLKKDELAAKVAKGNPSKAGDRTESSITSEQPIDQSAGEKGSGTFYKQLEDKSAQLGQGMSQLVYNIFNEPGALANGAKNPIKYNQDGTYSYNIDPNDPKAFKSKDEAISTFQKAYTEARAAAYSGKNPAAARDFANLVDPVAAEVDNLNFKKNQIERPFAASIEKFKQETLASLKPKYQIKAPTEDGKMVTISLKPTDFVDIHLIDDLPSSNSERENARKRLQKSIGKEQYDALYSGTISGLSNFRGDAETINAFNKVTKSLKQNGLEQVYIKREQSFKEAQTAFKPLQTTLLLADKDKEEVAQQFRNIAKGYNVNDNEGDFAKFLSADDEKKKALINNNDYSVNFDKNTGKYQLEVSRGVNKEQRVTLDVSKQDVINLGLKPDNPFWDKFGSLLSLTKNKSTDVQGVGQAKSIQLQQPPDSKYSVRYHLVGNGDKYQLVLYANDKAGNTVLSGIRTPNLFTEEAIMQIVNSGIKDADIEKLKNK